MEDSDARTIWCGNLSKRVTEELLYELFLQAAPIERVRIPKDKGQQAQYGFVTVKHLVSVPYSIELLNGVELFGRPLNLKPRNLGQNHASQNHGNVPLVVNAANTEMLHAFVKPVMVDENGVPQIKPPPFVPPMFRKNVVMMGGDSRQQWHERGRFENSGHPREGRRNESPYRHGQDHGRYGNYNNYRGSSRDRRYH